MNIAHVHAARRAVMMQAGTRAEMWREWNAYHAVWATMLMRKYVQRIGR